MSAGPNGINLLNNTTDLDLQAASDIKTGQTPEVIWPLPRSPKIDTATVLRGVLTNYGFTKEQIPIITNCAFQVSTMRDKEEFYDRPVIQIVRANDTAVRESIGELTEVFTSTDIANGAVNDPNKLVENLGNDTLLMKEQTSDELIDIFIYDENDQRAEQLYLLIKITMFACRKTFCEELGYKDVIRRSGTDGAQLVNSGEGGVYVVFTRHLQYSMPHYDFVAGIDHVIRLIQETYTVNDPSGVATTASASANL